MKLPKKSYVICSTMRSGSYLVSGGLADTGIAGYPEEYFSPPFNLPASQWFSLDKNRYRKMLLEHWEKTPASVQIEKIIGQGTTMNGVFGLKLHAFQLPYAMDVVREHLKEHGAHPFDLFSRAFGPVSYIWLQRRDKVAQAVSLHKAMQTLQFTKKRGEAPAENARELTDEDFDFNAINKHLSGLVRDENRWGSLFHAALIEPLVMVYEDVVDNYPQAINSILEFLQIDCEGLTINESRYERQSDRLSEEWISRFNTLQRSHVVSVS